MKKSWLDIIERAKRYVRTHPAQIVLLIFLLCAIGTQIGLVVNQRSRENQESARILALPGINMKDLSEKAEGGNVTDIISHTVRGGTWLEPDEKKYLEVLGKDGKHFALEMSTAGGTEKEMGEMLFGAARKHAIQFRSGSQLTPLATQQIFGVIIIIMIFLLFITFGQKLSAEMLGGASFKPQKPNLNQTLDDVIGYDAVKDRLREISHGLNHYAFSVENGTIPPRGVLLTGGPGVGKSLMARCFANELGADFFVASGSDFAEMYVGVGPKRVKSLFKLARLSRIAVIFVDEIDALGSRTTMGNDTERLATLNQMLVEMDGTNGNGRIVVIGATNAEERLDPALLRAGRFDLKILVPLPDAKTRKGILDYHLRKRPVDSTLDLDAVAMRTQGYSGAELRGLIEEAARLAAREAKNDSQGNKTKWIIGQDELLRAQEISRMGVDQPTSHPKDRVRVAIHELGHALLGWKDNPDLLIEKVTIEGRGQALGYAWTRPLEERRLMDHEQAKGRLRMFLAGRAAEEIVLGTVSAGAADDLRKAQDLANHLVIDFGIGARSGLSRPVVIDSYGRETLTDDGRKDAAELVEQAYEETKSTIKEYLPWITNTAELLIAKGTLVSSVLFAGLPERTEIHTAGQKWANSLVETLTQRQLEITHGDIVP